MNIFLVQNLYLLVLYKDKKASFKIFSLKGEKEFSSDEVTRIIEDLYSDCSVLHKKIY